MLATKEKIIAQRQFATERYILSTLPLLYLPFYRLDSGSSGGEFVSTDGHGYICTDTGTLINQLGRTFDGSDDVITIPDNALFTFGNSLVDVPFSILGWMKPDSTDPGALISKLGELWGTREYQFTPAGGTNQLMLALSDASTQVSPYRLADAAYSPLNAFHQFGVTYDGTGGATAANGIILYTDGASVASTATNQATYVAMEDTAQTVRIGVASISFGKGIIGEVIIYRNRILSAIEVQNIYLATRWRYS